MHNITRKILAGAGLAALLAMGAAQAQPPEDPMVPWFEVDPYWPKPLPNHWRLAMVIGLSMDAKDNVWILHRPQTLEQKLLMYNHRAAYTDEVKAIMRQIE